MRNEILKKCIKPNERNVRNDNVNPDDPRCSKMGIFGQLMISNKMLSSTGFCPFETDVIVLLMNVQQTRGMWKKRIFMWLNHALIS